MDGNISSISEALFALFSKQSNSYTWPTGDVQEAALLLVDEEVRVNCLDEVQEKNTLMLSY